MVFKNVKVAANCSNAVVKTENMVDDAFRLHLSDLNSPDDVSMAAARDVVGEGKEKRRHASAGLENKAANLQAGVQSVGGGGDSAGGSGGGGEGGGGGSGNDDQLPLT